MPHRIQRRRIKGWHMPPNTIHVARPSRWGNPFVVGKTAPAHWVDGATEPVEVRDRAHAVELYRALLRRSPARCDEIRAGLAARNLACWCPLVDADGQPVPCHADVMLAVARGEAP